MCALYIKIRTIKVNSVEFLPSLNSQTVRKFGRIVKYHFEIWSMNYSSLFGAGKLQSTGSLMIQRNEWNKIFKNIILEFLFDAFPYKSRLS